MKIDPSRLHGIGRSSLEPISTPAVAAAGPTAAEGAAPPVSADQVTLSQRAEQLQAARAALAAIPEIRQQRVAELKAQIESGQYQVDPLKVAERILNPRT